MSLQKLPTELLLLISKYLPESDKYSLRITSRALRARMPRDTDTLHWRFVKVDHLQYERRFGRYSCKVHELLAFRTRLTRPGNIFADNDMLLCAYCLGFGKSSIFPVKDMLINGLQVCEFCIVNTMRDCMAPGTAVMTYRGIDCKICDDCHNHHELGDFVEHDSEPKRYLCKDCHMDCCMVEHCGGWSVEDVFYNFGHFFNGDWNNDQGLFVPEHCEKCREVEAVQEHWKDEERSFTPPRALTGAQIREMEAQGRTIGLS